MASEFELYQGYTVCFYVEAVAEQAATDFGAFSQLLMNAAHESVLAMITPDPAHTEQVPRFWLGDVTASRGSSNAKFEVRAVVPEKFTAESLLNAIADELEPLGWGIAHYPRGAIAKQEEARSKLRMQNVGKLGKSLY